MTETADIGSKRLISLAPEVWARWRQQIVTVATLDEVVKAVQGLTLGAGNNGFTNGQTNS